MIDNIYKSEILALLNQNLELYVSIYLTVTCLNLLCNICMKTFDIN